MMQSKHSEPQEISHVTVAAAQSSAGNPSSIKTEVGQLSDPVSALGEYSDEDKADTLEKERPFRRKRRVKGQKICGVCGDLAQSYNFGAMTCETCKAFFRRNAFKQKELHACVFNSSCTITKATRRFCAPCRLKKCYAIGMDPELILDDDEKKARQTKRDREETKSGKKEKQQFDTHVTTSDICGVSPSSLSTSTTQPAADFCSDTGAHASTTFDYPDKGKWRRPRNALGCHFKHVTREDLPWNMQIFWPLTTEERSLLTKLTSSYQSVTSAVSSEDLQYMNQWESFCMEKAIFALEFSMRKYVQFARCIPEFQQLSQGDQISVLKASALGWYHVRMAADFLPERRSWVNMFGAMSEDELGKFFGDMNGVKEYADFCEGFKFVVKNDTTLYALIHILLLFDPRDQNIENHVLVNSIKDKYIILLKHHLESQFSFLHADRYLAEVVEQIMDLQQLTQSSLTFYKHFSSQFRPLIAEVLSD